MSYDEKATVHINVDGNVLKCAKGLAASECGYVKGADLCAKCGAAPMEMKMVPIEAPASIAPEQPMASAPAPKKKPKLDENGNPILDAEGNPIMEEDAPAEEDMKASALPEEDDPSEDDQESMIPADEEIAPYGEAMDDDESMDDDENVAKPRTPVRQTGAMKGVPNLVVDPAYVADGEGDEEVEEDENGMPIKKKGMHGAEDVIEDEEEDEEEVKGMHGTHVMPDGTEMDDEDMPVKKKKLQMPETGEDEEDEEDEEDAMAEKSFSANDPEWEEIRSMRIKSMGIDEAEMGTKGYVCALERKGYNSSTPVCDDCPGGCVAEKGLPGILHVEGLAEKMFNGVVIDSGYSSDADMFVVDVQTKDGSVKEVFIDGTSAEVMGFHKLDNSEFEQKSDFGGYKLIDFTEAAEIAVKSIDGHVVAVEPDVFEGFDSYAVEIEGFDGKSYDVFVALDGEILGYDKYEQDEAASIEAEAAEIALKRAFSETRRFDLAKTGEAMADGSYPIVKESDLRNAIQAFGRAKDKDATKKHIMKRARALKLESLVPANWLAGTEEKGDSLNEAEFMAALVEFQLLEDTLDNEF